MNLSRIAGVALVVIGIVALVWGGVFWTNTKTVIDAGPLQVTADEREGLALPPVLGAIALVGGIVLLVVPSSGVARIRARQGILLHSRRPCASTLVCHHGPRRAASELRSVSPRRDRGCIETSVRDSRRVEEELAVPRSDARRTASGPVRTSSNLHSANPVRRTLPSLPIRLKGWPRAAMCRPNTPASGSMQAALQRSPPG